MDTMSLVDDSTKCPGQCETREKTSDSTSNKTVIHSGNSTATELCTSASGTSTFSKSMNTKAQDNTSVNTNNVSDRHPSKRLVSKVVPSRFKAAAAAAASKENSSGNNSSSGPNSGRNRLNVTLASSTLLPGKKLVQRSKPQRLDTGSYGESKCSAMTGYPSGAAARKDGHMKRPRRVPGHGSTGKLHSTILNATITDIPTPKSVTNEFSTTMVGGFAPGNRNLDISIRVASLSSLPDLPNVSAIELESKMAESTTLPQGERSVEAEVKAEDLEHEYMSYLQWHYLSVNSEAAFAAQLTELQNLISFLEQLSSEKEKELSEVRESINFLLHHQKATDAHHTQIDLLQALLDGIPASEDVERNMSKELEKSLNQVKIDNLYIPQNHEEYRDELSEVLHTQLSLLGDLRGLMEPRLQYLKSTQNLLCELQNTTQHIQQCEHEVQQAASLAVQEASLQIGAKQMSA